MAAGDRIRRLLSQEEVRMQRLSGIDSMFLSLESQTNLFQVGALSIIDPSTAPEGSPPPYEALRRVILERLHLLAPFRRRLVAVPGGLDHPRWIEDPDFDIDRHLRRGALPSPGGPAELARYAADVLSQPLDRTRPLWEIHVVEGLEGGLIAGVAKIHHAAIDGVSGVELTANLMDLTPATAAVPPPSEPWRPGQVPSWAALVGAALWDLGGVMPAAVATTTARTLQAALRIARHNRRRDTVAPPLPFSAPRTSLGTRLGRRRTVGLAQVDRADVEAVRSATSATFNDVILTLAGAVLRSHLEDRGELPSKPLVAFVPVSVRSDDKLDTGVNRLSGMLVSLATTVEDPVVRLMAVSECSRHAKAQDKVLGPDIFSSIAELALPSVLGPMGRLVLRAGVTTRWPPFNVTVSSFPGPPVPLYCAGGKLLAYHPFGPVFDGASLNITAMSYLNQVGFGLFACGDAVPDVDLMACRIPEALTQLVKATAG
jgi:diacylglycerol O-acyltransferase / wax synthase